MSSSNKYMMMTLDAKEITLRTYNVSVIHVNHNFIYYYIWFFNICISIRYVMFVTKKEIVWLPDMSCPFTSTHLVLVPPKEKQLLWVVVLENNLLASVERCKSTVVVSKEELEEEEVPSAVAVISSGKDAIFFFKLFNLDFECLVCFAISFFFWLISLFDGGE